MAANLLEHRDAEPRDTGRPAWTEMSGILIALLVAMVALVIANTVVS
jgi:hypothetical protein